MTILTFNLAFNGNKQGTSFIAFCQINKNKSTHSETLSSTRNENQKQFKWLKQNKMESEISKKKKTHCGHCSIHFHLISKKLSSINTNICDQTIWMRITMNLQLTCSSIDFILCACAPIDHRWLIFIQYSHTTTQNEWT